MKILIIFFKILFLVFVSIGLLSCEKKPEQRNGIALAHLIDGDTIKAIKELDKAINDKPEYIDAHINRAKIYSALHNYDFALDDFEHVLKIEPNNFEAIKGRGLINLELKQYEHAIKDFNAAISKIKNDPKLFLFRAYSFFEIDLLIMACEDWQSAAELGSKEAEKYLSEYCTQTME